MDAAVTNLRILEALSLGTVWQARGKYKTLHSARVQAQKYLNNQVALGKLERGKGYYRVPGCKSEYAEHARHLTAALVQILCAYSEAFIHREHTISEVGLRPDALVLLTRGGEGLCLWLEVCLTEPEEYFRSKVNALKAWDARPYLSRLFGYRIPAFHIVKDSQLNQFLGDIHGRD